MLCGIISLFLFVYHDLQSRDYVSNDDDQLSTCKGRYGLVCQILLLKNKKRIGGDIVKVQISDFTEQTQ